MARGVKSSPLREVLAEIRHAEPFLEHELLAVPGRGATCVIVFGADRGLCGGFNRGLLDALEAFLEARGPGTVRLWVMGRAIARRVRRLGGNVDRTLARPDRAAREGMAAELASEAGDGFRGGTCREIRLLYTRFVPGGRNEPPGGSRY